MKKIILIGFLISLMTACAKEEPSLSRQQMQAKADSIVAGKLDDLNRQYQEDLDNRMVIEVKPKADSIVRAIQARADSL